jgi:metal-responsive CopG/Arc/MetJ family transcriptional regulator
MKTAISIPDSLFEVIEETAKEMGVSRSKLFSLAVKEFLKDRNIENVTNRLNECYDKDSSKLNKNIESAQLSSISGEEW